MIDSTTRSALTRTPRALWVLLVLVLIAQPTEIAAMGKTLCLFSEVEGTVTEDGRPVLGAEVERVYEWRDQPRSERTTTGADGRFAFSEAIADAPLSGVLPQEPVVPQRIIIRVRGQEYKGWLHTRHDYDRGSELGGRPLRLDCDIERKAEFHEGWFGICTLSGG